MLRIRICLLYGDPATPTFANAAITDKSDSTNSLLGRWALFHCRIRFMIYS